VSLSGQATVAAQTKTCAKSLQPRLIVGGLGRVTNGNSNNVRNEASTGDLVGQIRSDETFEVLDGPICADGEYWWRVHYSDFVGWTAEAQDSNYWLTPYVPHFKLATENHTIQVTYDNLHFEVSSSLTSNVNYHFGRTCLLSFASRCRQSRIAQQSIVPHQNQRHGSVRV
jgi:hypothetical protein